MRKNKNNPDSKKFIWEILLKNRWQSVFRIFSIGYLEVGSWQ